MTYKVCPGCKVEKGRSEFYSNKVKCDGLSTQCKVCVKASLQKYRKENAEKVTASKAKYRKENAEKEKARKAEYRKENAEKLKAYHAYYLKNNREKVSLMPSKVKGLLGLSSVKEVPQELIELKRLHLQMKRLIKQQGK